ncbi:MAG: tryptophan synthase subunit alpha [Bacteroidota bacterium]
MNRIDQLFKEKRGEILSVYTTAGYPDLNDTPALLRALQTCGTDMVEIGIPFSDPLADGPVIQQSSQFALQNGMNLKLLFRQLSGIRSTVHIPLVLMGYLNPVLQMGMEIFLEKCHEVGIDGVIIPDLPPYEYESRYLDLFKKYGIHHILLITPHTSTERIHKIARLSKGFLYLVSDASTTGVKSGISQHQVDYFQRIRSMALPLPGLIGFGISNHETFKTACMHAEGAIIGSAFIRAMGEKGPLEEKVVEFIRSVKGESG